MCRPQDNSILDVNSFALVSTDLFGSTHHILYTLAHTHSTTPPHIYRHIICTHTYHMHTHTHMHNAYKRVHNAYTHAHLSYSHVKYRCPDHTVPDTPYCNRIGPRESTHTHATMNLEKLVSLSTTKFVSNSSKEYAG